MSILEMESTGQGTPQGVVLALVGSVIDDPSKEQESIRTLRMYNLASLVSLAKWAIAQKVSRLRDSFCVQVPETFSGAESAQSATCRPR